MQRKTNSSLSSQRKKILFTLLCSITAGMALAAAPALAQSASSQTGNQAQITVYASGTASAKPDMALLNLSVSNDAASAREALDQTNAAMNKVITAIKAAGVANDDMQTLGLTVQPRYEPSERYPSKNPEPQGYQASNVLNVKIRDLGKLGPIIDDAVTNGANGLNQMTLTNANLQPLYDEAHKNAVANALAKAKLLAGSAGVSVGRILRIDENSSSMEPMLARSTYASAASIAAGKNSYNVNISVTMELVTKR